MTFSFPKFRRVTVPIAMAALGLVLACGTEVTTRATVVVTPPTVVVSPLDSTIDPGELEITVAESSVSVTPRRLGVGELFQSAPSDYYDAYDWDTAPTTERPAFLDGVVQHRTLSPEVGIRGLSITTVASRGAGENPSGYSTNWLWSEDPTVTPIGATQPYPLSRPKDVSLEVGQEFVPYLLFESHSGFEGTTLVTAIVDYEQVEFKMDGMNGLLHEFKTLPGRMLAIPINFGSFSRGAHDIEVVVINDPYKAYGHTDPEAALYSTTEWNLLTFHSTNYRVRLVVGDDETPARILTLDGLGAPPSSKIKAGPGAIFSEPGAETPLGRENHLRVGEGEAGETFNFRTWSGRWDSIGDGTQVLMLFMDYKMIPFNGDKVHTLGMEAGEIFSFETAITLPDEPGDHQMIGMVMYEPCRSMVDARFEEFDTSHEKVVINAR